ncbi:hypothetical protein AB0A63_09570 [Lentzea sp. NPDC042327]|uniref:hypothetical protein n=1 Tax=Lentzea sp. NPDC042327 TaxID=3154801 RepID=UPI00340C39EC
MIGKLLGSALLVTALLGGTAGVASATPDAGALAARGYVDEGNLRKDPNLGAALIVTIHDQWVDINCWIDGGPNGFGSNRWFKATYCANVGYLSSGVVSHQPSVGHC